MKYVVRFRGSDAVQEVIVVADAVNIDGDLVVGQVAEVEGTPVGELAAEILGRDLDMHAARDPRLSHPQWEVDGGVRS